MANDEAQKRHGVEPTYKKVKGFQPLQLTWEAPDHRCSVSGWQQAQQPWGYRPQDGQPYRQVYPATLSGGTPNIIRRATGFFDQKLLQAFAELGLGVICSGRIYEDIQNFAERAPHWQWRRYQNRQQAWDYLEYGDRRGSWDTFRRVILCRPVVTGKQRLLAFARPLSVYYTNLGMGGAIDQRLAAVGREQACLAENIIAMVHGRGADELVHRALKDFGFEELPFLRFGPNVAFYYTMLVAFFLFECFKEDVCQKVVPLEADATTLRRQVIDSAAKMVRHAGQVILKVTAATMARLQFAQLWDRCNAPPQLVRP